MRVAGKIVEVKGGHIVRSNNNSYQRHKVCTAKGPRDRRFRLSALTAIKFYDVQDRLGYDRPSKAVDWLMKNAKASIDELTEASQKHMKKHIPSTEDTVSDPFSFGCVQNTSFLPPSLDSDAIADTIKSFFPVAPQDLRLSLQSFGDLIFQQNPADSGDLPLAGGYELGHCQLCAQRRTIESSNSISVCPWMDPMELQMHPTASSIGSSGFHIPARIQGEEEREGGTSSSRR